MKNFKYILLALFASIFASCDDDTGIYVPEDATPPVVTSTNTGTFTLSKVNENDDFQTFEWTDADFKIAVAPKYSLQVDVAGNNFANPRTIVSGISSPYTISVGEFNKGLLNGGFTAGESYELEVKIVAGNYLTSEASAMTVTTYFDAEPWSIIGAAVGGWNPENDQFMNYDQTTETYSLTLDMSPGDFKFRAPKKDEDVWKFNYGIDGNRAIDNEENVPLKDGGDNISVSGGNYTVTLNLNALTFTIVQNSAAEYTNWSDVELELIGGGVSEDNAASQPDGSSWGWGRVLNSGAVSANGAVYTWTWSNVVIEANEGFKIRTLNGEAASNGISFDTGYADLDADNSSSNIIDDGGNLKSNTKATYDITIVINAADGNAKTITINEPAPEYPENLYMIGGALGGWNWGTDDIQMIPVNGTPHQFWSIAWLDAAGGTDGVKFSPDQGWEGGQFGYETDLGNGEYSKGDANLPAPATSGYYMVVVDLLENKISITDPQVYLIGNTIGSWDPAFANGLFTVDNDNEKLTITKDLSSGELRMYAAHSYFNSADWWRTEFIILNNVIEFRGNGGDQDRVSLTGVTTTIDLNFKTLAGTITQ